MDIDLLWASGPAVTDATFISGPGNSANPGGIWRYKWSGTNWGGGMWTKVTNSSLSTGAIDIAGKGTGSAFTLWAVNPTRPTRQHHRSPPRPPR